MSTSTLRRRSLVLLLAATLTTPWAWAAGPKVHAAAAGAGVFDRAVYFLGNLWAELGCHLDPDGRCTTQPVQPKVDLGCHLDPSGSCKAPAAKPVKPRVEVDSGCHFDPNGNCIH